MHLDESTEQKPSLQRVKRSGHVYCGRSVNTFAHCVTLATHALDWNAGHLTGVRGVSLHEPRAVHATGLDTHCPLAHRK